MTLFLFRVFTNFAYILFVNKLFTEKAQFKFFNSNNTLNLKDHAKINDDFQTKS